MKKKKILEAIKLVEKELDRKFDLRYDEETATLFYELEDAIDLPFSVVTRNENCDYWIQCEYDSKKLSKTIIWSYDVGNFDDYDEVADYIINTAKEIKNFESRITFKR